MAEPVLQWVTISDFTPGMVTNTRRQAGGTGGITQQNPGNQLGQANTAVGCIAMPNGGLTPLPGLGTPIAPPASTVPIAGYTNIVNGLFVNGPIAFVAGGGSPVGPGPLCDSIIVGVEALQNTAANRDFYLFDFMRESNGFLQYSRTLEHPGPAANNGGFGSGFATMTGGLTMDNHSTPTSPGQPLWALSYWFMAAGTNPNWLGQPFQWLYPDPTVDANAPFAWTNPVSNYPAYVICHNNRIVLVHRPSNINRAAHWTDSFHLSSGCEVWDFTDPPNSDTLGTQESTFVQENPTGVAAWGSISAGELFAVKNNGGGFLLSGDFIQPQITRLPGITPAYGLVSRTALTPIGLVYASNNNGVYAWNGGNTSRLISGALDPSFTQIFTNALSASFGPPRLFDGPGFDICRWGDWIICSGDLLYDTLTNSWWQLPLGTGLQVHYWYGVSNDGQTLYACPLNPTASYLVDLYQESTPANKYQWTSYPIRLPQIAENRQGVVKEVVIRAQGQGTIVVTITGKGATSSISASSPSATLTYTVSDLSQPRMQRIEVGSGTGGPMLAEDIIITITSTGQGSGGAPILYSLAVGYFEDKLVSAT